MTVSLRFCIVNYDVSTPLRTTFTQITENLMNLRIFRSAKTDKTELGFLIYDLQFIIKKYASKNTARRTAKLFN